MAKITLNNLANLQNETSAVGSINDNNDKIEAAIENTLSRDGTSPNTMNNQLDMNSHQIVNLPLPVSPTSPLRIQDLDDFIGSADLAVNSAAAAATSAQEAETYKGQAGAILDSVSDTAATATATAQTAINGYRDAATATISAYGNQVNNQLLTGGAGITAQINQATTLFGLTQNAANQTTLASQAASGNIIIYGTKAEANTVLGALNNLQVIEIIADESQMGRRTRYRKESGAFVFKLFLPMLGAPMVLLDTGQSNDVNGQSISWNPPSNLLVWNFGWSGTGVPPVGTSFYAPYNSPYNTVITRPIAKAAEIARQNPDRMVYLIPIACSGQYITNWLPGATVPDVYAAIQANMTAALPLTGASQIDAFSWGQGENDQGTNSATYQTYFGQVMNRFFAEAWFPRATPMTIWGIAPTSVTTNVYADQMNVTLQQLANVIGEPRTFVDIGKILASSDWTDVHITTAAGFFKAGKLAANALLNGKGYKSPAGAHINSVTGNWNIGANPLVSSDRLYVDNAVSAKTFAQNVVPSAAPLTDASRFVVTLNTGQNVLLGISRSGKVFVSEQYMTGSVAEYLLGQGFSIMGDSIGSTWVNGTTTPPTGKCSIAYDGSTGYRLYNNLGNGAQFCISQHQVTTF